MPNRLPTRLPDRLRQHATAAARSLGLAGIQPSPQQPAVEPKLRFMPPTLWPVDEIFLSEWQSGYFPLAGHSVKLAASTPFDLRDAPRAWRDALFGFSWLRHIPRSLEPADRARFDAALTAWLDAAHNLAEARTPAIHARRIVSWLAHADILLETPEPQIYDRLLTALCADISALERATATPASQAARLLACIALVEAALCITDFEPRLVEFEARLARELGSPDPTVAPRLRRSAGAMASVILDIEALRTLYRLRAVQVPPSLTAGVTDLVQALATLDLGGEQFARLGAAAESETANLRMLLLAMAHRIDRPVIASRHDAASGVCRLVLGHVRVVVDLGMTQETSHALQLEMTSDSAPLLAHDGSSSNGVVIPIGGSFPVDASNDELQSRATMRDLSIDLASSSALHLDATDASRARSGFVHRRRITLSNHGRKLGGVDDLRPLIGSATMPDQRFAIRFVLHPTVTVTFGDTSSQLRLTLSNGEKWLFSAEGYETIVESQRHREGLKSRPTLQILVLGHTTTARSVRWHLLRDDDKSAPLRPLG